MPYRMEQHSGIAGLPGLLLMGFGIFLLQIQKISVEPKDIQIWLGAFSFFCSGVYYIYKLYSDYKRNNKNNGKDYTGNQ